MTHKMLNVRIPESMDKYIKMKAVVDGSNKQAVVQAIISNYQQQDHEFMARFPQFKAQKQNEEMSDGV